MWSLAVVWAMLGQQKAPGVEQVLKPELTLLEKKNAQDKGIDTWIMSEFVFIPPRMITVDIPGKGRRLLWYMVYRVTNRTEKERRFLPKFLLVTDKGDAYIDAIIPKGQRAIQSREDPLRPLENSITISGEIERSIDEGIDKPVYGVAIWDGVNPKLSSFDIFVSGLSNAYKIIEDPATGEKKTQRKTLVLKFARPGDEFFENEREIKYIGNEWIYK